MNPTPSSNPPGWFSDPRHRSEFRQEFHPRVNGRETSALNASDRNDRVSLEFAAAYYDLNAGYARLLETRKSLETPEHRENEKKCLQSIEAALIVRDRLEDHYAPFGVIAEPVVKDGFTVNVKISFGNVDAAGRRRSEEYTITARVPIPLPGGINFEDLPIKIEGPGINPE
jgi:hypothetical protein